MRRSNLLFIDVCLIVRRLLRRCRSSQRHIPPIPPPHLIRLRQLPRGLWVCEICQQNAQRSCRGAGGGCGRDQLDDFDAAFAQRVNDFDAALVAWDKHRDGWLLFVGNVRQRIDITLDRLCHRFEFLFGREFFADELDRLGIVGRVDGFIALWHRQDVRQRKRRPRLWVGVFSHDPVDEMIRQRNHRRL